MKKTFFAIALATITLMACGGKTDATSDLSGTWTSEKSGDSYQEAIITDKDRKSVV